MKKSRRKTLHIQVTDADRIVTDYKKSWSCLPCDAVERSANEYLGYDNNLSDTSHDAEHRMAEAYIILQTAMADLDEQRLDYVISLAQSHKKNIQNAKEMEWDERQHNYLLD